jgi:hypothetical protein
MYIYIPTGVLNKALENAVARGPDPINSEESPTTKPEDKFGRSSSSYVQLASLHKGKFCTGKSGPYDVERHETLSFTQIERRNKQLAGLDLIPWRTM